MNDLVSLSKLFDKRIFRIPDYQRGYAWGNSQLNDFWEDLVSLTTDRYHYTGMLSLKKVGKEIYDEWKEEKWIIEDQEYEPFHIVDGQQRITTFIILINSILQYAQKKNIEYINGVKTEDIKRRYIVEYNMPLKISKAFKFGYESDNPSFEFLRYNVLGEGSSGTLIETFYTLNLENAKNFFDEKIKESCELNDENWLQDLFKKLVNKFQFNIHYIDNDFDVYVAFETMNNRGKKLSNLEILKNRLIYLTTIYPDDRLPRNEKEQLRKDINDAWKEVYYQLGRNKRKPLNDDEYLRNHWSLYFKYSRNTGNDYIEFLLGEFFNPKAVYGIKRGMILNDESDDFDEEHIPEEKIFENSNDKLFPSEIIEYVNSLKEVAQYWYYSFNPSECKFFTRDEIIWIDKLNRIGIGYFRTIVVASFINDLVTSEQRVVLLQVIEKFIFLCFRMARYQSSFLSNVTYAFARELIKKQIEIDEIIKYFEEKFSSNIVEATNTFLAKITSAFKYKEGYYSWYDLRYFLFEYEMSLAEKTFIVKMDDWSNFTKNERDKISIEHIFPQTPTRWYWRNQFRDYNNDEKKCLANSLGNLIPLSQSINSALQNDEFELKKNPKGNRKRGYSNGSNSEIEVSKYENWNPQTILERGKHLLNFIEERWQFKFGESKILDILGLPFMKESRPVTPELPQEDFTRSDSISVGEDALNLKNYFIGKNQEMIDIYYALFQACKEKISNLYEVVTKNNVYIALRNDMQTNIAEVRIQKSQIKITINEPKQEKNKIGKFLSDSYNWSKTYCILLNKIEDVEKVVDAIVDSYSQLL